MVAETILRQLGGKRFAVMTGSKNFIDGGNFLSMKLARNSSKANYLRITLTSMDDYTMEFLKISTKGCNLVEEVEGVYCDQLQDIFTDVTGLYTRL